MYANFGLNRFVNNSIKPFVRGSLITSFLFFIARKCIFLNSLKLIFNFPNSPFFMFILKPKPLPDDSAPCANGSSSSSLFCTFLISFRILSRWFSFFSGAGFNCRNRASLK